MSAEIVTKEDLQPILECQKRLEEKLDLLIESLPAKEVYTIGDICRMLQISKNQARSRPYLLPNYGVSDYPGRIRKWRVETYRAWIQTSPTQHKQEWNIKSFRERQVIMSAISKMKEADGVQLRKVI